MKRTRKILERSCKRIFCGQPGGTRRGAASEMAALPSEPQSSTPLQNFSAWMRKAPHGILLFWKPSDIRTSSQTRRSLPEYTNAAMNSTIRHPCFLYGRKNKNEKCGHCLFSLNKVLSAFKKITLSVICPQDIESSFFLPHLSAVLH